MAGGNSTRNARPSGLLAPHPDGLASASVIIVAAPRHNVGGYLSLLALRAAREQSEVAGITLHLGRVATATFSRLHLATSELRDNSNLRTRESPFGQLHTLALTLDAENRIAQLHVDGLAEGKRNLDGRRIGIDQVVVGARHSDSGFRNQPVDGFCEVDLAEVLIYDRPLSSTIGPDLSNLIHRDYSSVLRDIVNPNFAINPDHLSYTVILNDGRVFTGVVHESGDTLHIGDVKGTVVDVDRATVEEIRPAPVSTMPEGLVKQFDHDRIRDLMTFLLTAPP